MADLYEAVWAKTHVVGTRSAKSLTTLLGWFFGVSGGNRGSIPKLQWGPSAAWRHRTTVVWSSSFPTAPRWTHRSRRFRSSPLGDLALGLEQREGRLRLLAWVCFAVRLYVYYFHMPHWNALLGTRKFSLCIFSRCWRTLDYGFGANLQHFSLLGDFNFLMIRKDHVQNVNKPSSKPYKVKHKDVQVSIGYAGLFKTESLRLAIGTRTEHRFTSKAHLLSAEPPHRCGSQQGQQLALGWRPKQNEVVENGKI